MLDGATGTNLQQAGMPIGVCPEKWILENRQGMSRDAMQANLTRQLNVMQQCGINTVIFQVRGEADAFYNSPYEPWSRFLTGQQGKAPDPYWDPLEWMVQQCHRRGMELHAWINPFRAKTKGTTELSMMHPYVQNTDRFFEYDGLILFDPGLPENHLSRMGRLPRFGA